MDKLSLLKSVTIFNGLEEKLLQQLVNTTTEVALPSGKIIFNEGDPSDSFYIIDAGEVTIYKKVSAAKEKTLALFSQGQIFGEMAFFSDLPRTANAKTAAASTLLRVSRSEFLTVLNAQPKEGLRILSKILEVVMERLEQTSRELATVHQTGKIISSGRNLQDIVKLIQDEVLLAVPEANQVLTFLYNKFNQEYEAVSSAHPVCEISVEGPFMRALLNYSNGIILNDTTSADMLPKLDCFKNAQSLIICPFLKESKILGFFVFSNTVKTGAFKNTHLLLVSSVANQMAEAIENINFQQEERDRQRLRNAKMEY